MSVTKWSIKKEKAYWASVPKRNIWQQIELCYGQIQERLKLNAGSASTGVTNRRKEEVSFEPMMPSDAYEGRSYADIITAKQHQPYGNMSMNWNTSGRK